MSLDLTKCGHLRTDSNGNQVFCDKCRPASQKQAPLDDKAAAIFMTNVITPLIETWFNQGKLSANQVAGNLMGMGMAIALQVGIPKEHVLSLVEACFAPEPT